MNNDSPVLSERFWSKVHVSKRARCWPWLGAKDSFGYGQVRHGGKTDRAPRVAFYLRNNRWPNNACHSCDNPICCNPDHIFDGSRSDNMQDMVTKGRHRTNRGEAHYATKITDVEASKIRKEYKEGIHSIEAIAAKFASSFSVVQRIIARKTWKHIP